LREQLTAHGVPDQDRRQTEWAFNRKSRAEDNLYALVSRLLTDALAGKIDTYRGRWSSKPLALIPRELLPEALGASA
jgi:hypothetical protein